MASSKAGTGRSSTTFPALSCVSVSTPRIIVPEYSLSSLIKRSWIFVPRPSVSKSKPVAIGSSVPQWPTFFICKRRRTIATTSCEVIPAALSTRSTPSGVAVNDIANLLQNFLFHFCQCAAHTCARRQLVPAAAELLANRANIGRVRFRAHADAHFPIDQFLEEDRDDNALNRAQMVDQPLVVLRFRVQFRRGF